MARKGRGSPAGIAGLRRMASEMRSWIVDRSFRSGVGHIGSALSIVDVTAALWGKVMRNPGTGRPDRDRFVLAKGHAALAMYCAMRWNGTLSEKDFDTFCADGSPLGQHPERGQEGVDAATGSLGQGLSVACGMALALRLRRSKARVFALLSDAECNEGQVWEAAMFAAHHRLDNLVVAVDVNGLQALGRTRDVIDMAPLGPKWRAFGWEAREAGGHDLGALLRAFSKPAGRRPLAVMARTVMGKGVSFMEDRLEWHYRNLTPELHAKAMKELGRAR